MPLTDAAVRTLEAARRLGGEHFVVPRQVRIARGCVDLAVTKELADHRKALAKGQLPGRKVPAVVKPDDLQSDRGSVSGQSEACCCFALSLVGRPCDLT